jgi:competence protein ComEC
LVLTHGDLQHIGGFEAFLQQLPVSRVATSSLKFRSTAYRKIVNDLARTPERWQKVDYTDHIAGWSVMHPGKADRYRQADDGAMVLLAEVYGVRLLLLSDLGKAGQQTLLEREPSLRADIVVTGIPTSNEPVYPWLLESLKPRFVIVASAEYPAVSQGSRELRQRLNSLSVPVIFTTDTGTAVIELRPNHWEIRTPSGFVYSASAKNSKPITAAPSGSSPPAQ